MPEDLNQNLNPEIPKKPEEEKKEVEKDVEKDDLLELDEGSPEFVRDKNNFINKIRDFLEKEKLGPYKKEVEAVFINPEILDIAEDHGYEKAWEILKNEFFYNLKNDKEIDKKINLDRIISADRVLPLAVLAEKRKKEIEKDFEDSLKLSFLTQASKRLLEKYPDIDLILISSYLESSFASFIKKNENYLNLFFNNKKIKNKNGDELEVSQDKMVLTNIDFDNFQIKFESEKFQKINGENKNILQANKEVALIKFDKFLKSLESFVTSLPEPGFLSGKKKKIALENFKKEINILLQRLKTEAECVKGNKDTNLKFECSNIFARIFNDFKKNIDINKSVLSSKTKDASSKIVDEFSRILKELIEDDRQNHLISSSEHDNENKNYLKVKHYLEIPYNLDLKNKIAKIKEFNEFKEILASRILNQAFTRDELSFVFDKTKAVFKGFVDESDSEKIEKYQYFKKLRQEFSNFCDENKVDAKKKEEMLSRFF